jgi:hypothetical protein
MKRKTRQPDYTRGKITVHFNPFHKGWTVRTPCATQGSWIFYSKKQWMFRFTFYSKKRWMFRFAFSEKKFVRVAQIRKTTKSIITKDFQSSDLRWLMNADHWGSSAEKGQFGQRKRWEACSCCGQKAMNVPFYILLEKTMNVPFCILREKIRACGPDP